MSTTASMNGFAQAVAPGSAVDGVWFSFVGDLGVFHAMLRHSQGR